VEHSVAQVKPFTRMQIRVLDHKRWIEAMHLPAQITGRVTVAVRESEGSVSKFRIELAEGQASVTSSDASADAECPDVQWASVSSGDMAASTAARLGLIQANNPAALRVLDAFSVGQVPFCREYF
jgi:predicted acetyltransferase